MHSRGIFKELQHKNNSRVSVVSLRCKAGMYAVVGNPNISTFLLELSRWRALKPLPHNSTYILSRDQADGHLDMGECNSGLFYLTGWIIIVRLNPDFLWPCPDVRDELLESFLLFSPALHNE